VEQLQGIASPSALTCPECGGGLWEMRERQPLRFRCHTGHAFTALSLGRAQRGASEHALWSSVRALREREILLRRLARIAQATGDGEQACAGNAEADRVEAQARTLEAMAQALPTDMQEPTAP
jgi:two-component system chemotaxis response regulator CheB